MCGTRRQNQEWTGKWIQLDTNKLEMIFYTDDSIVDKGFRLQWRPKVTSRSNAQLPDFSINLKMTSSKCMVDQIKDRVAIL